MTGLTITYKSSWPAQLRRAYNAQLKAALPSGTVIPAGDLTTTAVTFHSSWPAMLKADWKAILKAAIPTATIAEV